MIQQNQQTQQKVLVVDGLTVRYKTALFPSPCVDSVSLAVEEGQVLGVVGESGCGKTTLARAIIGLLPAVGEITGGTVDFCGKNLLGMDKNSLKAIRGREIGMITQESLSSLNPVRKVGAQFIRLLGEKLGQGKAEALETAADFLGRMSCPADILNRYPFQLSGGQRQRALIAMAFALRPKLLIADEPTTALDVSVQAQVLQEIKRLRDECNTAVVLISHNLGVVSQICDDIAVMYRGAVVEYGEAKTVLREPSHSYTKGLIGCIPHLNYDRSKKLYGIPDIHTATGAAAGCNFAPRCSLRSSKCAILRPSLMPNDKGVLAACWS